MASKGEVGLDLDVRKVPLREADMEPFEIMISESQSGCCASSSRTGSTRSWRCARNGSSTRRPRSARSPPPGACAFDGDALVGDMPVTALSTSALVYDLEPVATSVSMYPPPEPQALPADAGGILVSLLGSAKPRLPPLAFEQYDCLVGSRTVRRPDAADAAVLQLGGRGSDSGAIAVSIDGNGRRVALDPYRGAVEAVLECSANLACVGAEPLGLTTASTSSNPEKPHVAWQLSARGRRLADALPLAGIPVVGGNVSLYNEAGACSVFPPRSSGLVASWRRPRAPGRLGFAEEGDVVAVISAGSWAPAAMGSELAKLRGEAAVASSRTPTSASCARSTPRVRQRCGGGAALGARCRRRRPRGRAGRGVPGGGLGATVDLSPLRPAGDALLSARARAR